MAESQGHHMALTVLRAAAASRSREVVSGALSSHPRHSNLSKIYTLEPFDIDNEPLRHSNEAPIPDESNDAYWSWHVKCVAVPRRARI